jgi:hypothetical protein
MVDRLTPGQLAVLDKLFGMARTATIGAAAKLRIADLLQAAPLSAHQIAERTGMDADAIHRLMRTLVSFGLFEMRPGARFVNNRLSDWLRSDQVGSLRDFAAYLGSASNLRAYADLEGTLRSGQNAFERVHGVNVWEWFGGHPDEGQTFAGAMQGATIMDAPAIAKGYPFGRLQQLCDVAGGRGALLSEILLHHPSLRGVLFDEAYVLAEADALLVKRGVHHRVEKVPGSFFERVPEGCEGYLMKDILHDWDDDRSCKILANIRRAAVPGTMLFLVETLLEPEETGHPKPMLDLHMMMVCVGGRQRSRAEFQRLLGDTGFHLDEVRPLGALHSLVVGRAG